jgi:hypothetical protein
VVLVFGFFSILFLLRKVRFRHFSKNVGVGRTVKEWSACIPDGVHATRYAASVSPTPHVVLSMILVQ